MILSDVRDMCNCVSRCAIEFPHCDKFQLRLNLQTYTEQFNKYIC